MTVTVVLMHISLCFHRLIKKVERLTAADPLRKSHRCRSPTRKDYRSRSSVKALCNISCSTRRGRSPADNRFPRNNRSRSPENLTASASNRTQQRNRSRSPVKKNHNDSNRKRTKIYSHGLYIESTLLETDWNTMEWNEIHK